MKTMILLTTQALVAILFLTSCGGPVGGSNNARYIEGGSEEGLVNLEKINSQDFQRAVAKLVQDLYTRGALQKAPTQPAVLFVGNVRNDTQTYFDTDLLLQSLKRDLISSGKVVISTTEGPGGVGQDTFAQEIRRKGELSGDPAVKRPKPYYTLSGKIIEQTSRVDKVTQKDFYFHLTLTEIGSGTGVWFGQELIAKQGKKGSGSF
ncbi:MAG: penicillin-binding protein activator LpoB [Opitutales bacterium]|jgi:PBP1b-binding outer membrane lipoprotein LpoB|nr:penicillin-binding protein activator LpoB [Opitutales bacterium]